MSNKNYKFLPKNLLVIFLIGAFAVVVVFGLYFSQFHSQLSNENSNWGTFGDFVGGTLNPLLSFLGLLALLLTVAMQRDELEKTHEVLDKQLAAQVEQLENAKKISDEQLKTQAKQQFESTFFALLNVHNQIFESFDKQKIHDHLVTIISDRASLNNAKSMLEANSHLYGHYFRILYQLLKFIAINSPNSQIGLNFNAENIKNSEVSLNEKMYSNVVRALFTNDIVQLLAVNCYCKNGENDSYWKYKLLVERYALFEHAPFRDCSRRYDDDTIFAKIRNFYDKKAFGL